MAGKRKSWITDPENALVALRHEHVKVLPRRG